MAGTPHERPTSLAAVLLAGLLALSVAAGTTGVGTAHGGTDHVVRNGDTLTIRLGDQHNATEARQVTVSVAGGKTRNLTAENATDTFTVAVERLAVPNENLRNATVTVEATNGTTITETANLRTLAFGGGQASLRADGTLHVPLKTALGYADGDDVTVALDGDRRAVSGTVRYDGDNASLAVSLDPANISLPVSEPATVQVPDRGSATVALRSLVRNAINVSRVGGETLVVTNPLLAPDSTYGLSIRTPAGRFSSTLETNGTGALTVSNAALADAALADAANVSAYRDGEPLFEEYGPPNDSEDPVPATVTPDGNGVKLPANASLGAEKVTVWLTNDSQSRYGQASVQVTDNGTVIDLRPSDYRLHPNGSYRLLVTDGAFARVNVTGGPNASNATNTLFYAPAGNASGNGTANGTSGGPLGLGIGTPFLVGGGVVGLLLAGGIVWFSSAGPGRGSSSDEAASAAAGNQTHTLHISVKDGGTNGSFDGEVAVTAEKMSSATAESTTVSGGRGSLELPKGTWDVTVETGDLSRQKPVDVYGDAADTFTLGPKQATVSVRDDEGRPVSHAEVECRPDAGQSKRRRPEDGSVSVNVPLDASEVELSADHEKYEGDGTTLTFDGDTAAEGSLTLRRLTGELRVTATVDGTAVPGVEVTVTPREEAVRQLGESERTATTGDAGGVAFDGMLVGRYEIGMAMPSGGDAFRTASKRVEVRDGRVVRESLDAAFEYSPDRRDRERIADVREEVESLASAGSRDVAIPRYYGTVVTDLLDAVERLPEEGHRFATVEADPDEVVTALLDAADETVDLLSNAMTTKRNTDLFGACANMSDERVEWSGEFEVADLFELLDEDRTAQRQTVLRQLRRVDDRIDDERSELAVVEPAREPWERIREFVNSERGEDLVRGAAVAFVAGGLLDAVDEMFDRERLRDRLERTVF